MEVIVPDGGQEVVKEDTTHEYGGRSGELELAVLGELEAASGTRVTGVIMYYPPGDRNPTRAGRNPNYSYY